MIGQKKANEAMYWKVFMVKRDDRSSVMCEYLCRIEKGDDHRKTPPRRSFLPSTFNMKLASGGKGPRR